MPIESRTIIASVALVMSTGGCRRTTPTAESERTATPPATPAPVAAPEPAASPTVTARFVPGGPLPQHRAWLANEPRFLQRAGDHWVWSDDSKVFRRALDGTSTQELFEASGYIDHMATSEHGVVAVVVDTTLHVLTKPAVRRDVPRPSSVAWCGDRLFVAGGSLRELVDGALVEVASQAGELSPRSCAGGRLSVRVKGGLRVLDLAANRWTELLSAAEPHWQIAYDTAVSTDGERVAAVEHLGGVRLWTTSGEPLAHWPGLGGQASSLAFCPDGRSLAVGGLRLSVPDLRLLGRAGDVVGSTAAWSPDGAHLAIGTSAGVTVLDVEGDDRTPAPRGLSDTARAMVLDQERRRLYTSEESGRVLGWSLDGPGAHAGPSVGTMFDTGEWGLDNGRRLALMPDGSVVTGVRDAAIRWSVAGERLEARSFPPPAGTLLSLSADGTRAAVSGSNTAYVIEWASGNTVLATGPYKEDDNSMDGSVEGLALHPDGDVVAVGGRSKTHVLSVDTGRSLAELDELPGYGNRVWFSPDGAQLLHTTSMGARLYAWPQMTSIDLPDEAQWADAATFSSAGEELVVSEWGGRLTRLRVGKQAEVVWSHDAPWHIGAHAVDFASRRVFTGGPDLELLVWDLDEGTIIDRQAAGAGRRTTVLAFSSSERYLASGDGQGAVHVFDLQQGRRHRYWVDPRASESEALQVSDDGTVTALDGMHLLRLEADDRARFEVLSEMSGSGGSVTATDGSVWFADFDSKQLITARPPAFAVDRKPLPTGIRGSNARVSPDGKWWLEIEEIWEPSRYDVVRLVELSSGRSVATLEVRDGHDVRHLGWADGAGWIWQSNGELLRWAPGHKRPKRMRVPPVLVPMAVGPGLVAGAVDQMVVVVDLKTGAVLHAFAHHEHRIDAMTMSADGSRLATGDFRGHIWVWDLEAGRALARIVAGVGGWNVWLADGGWHEGGYDSTER